MPSIYLTPTLSCEPKFCMFIRNSYFTKSKHLYSLDSRLKDIIIIVLFYYTGNTVDETVQWQQPLGGSKVDSAFHPSEVDKMSTRNIWELSGKK